MTPEYDTREAVRILSSARAIADASDLKAEREQAAKALLAAVIEAAKEAGFEHTTDPNGGQFLGPSSGGDVLSLQAGRDGIRMLLVDDSGRAARPKPPLPAAIAYDPVSKMWVGTELDIAIVPTPGQLAPMRSAVAAVADRIAEAFQPSK